MHIAVAGNIGSGKTTLTGMLAKHFGWIPVYETEENNPYLASFYENMQRWSFNLQIYFLNKRVRQILEIRKRKKSVISDRTIYEDAYIFAPNLHNMGLMASRDFENYASLFELMSSFIQPPDLLIYLKADIATLIEQIQKRGRFYESSLRLDYLQGLNVLYDQWIDDYEIKTVKPGLGKLLILDINSIKFVEDEGNFGIIVEKINAELFR